MSSKNPQSDYDQALALKDAGNAAFKKQDFKGALKNYSRIFMHIGMNPCMNMSQMMGGGGGPPNPAANSASKDPLQQKTDELRLTAFNNMAAVYAKMGKWEDCKEKCTRVLKHDEKNTKALFRRGMAHRKLNLYELARADLEKAKSFINNKQDAAIERELKLLDKDEKNADKQFYAKMKKQMQKAKKKKDKKKQEKADAKKKLLKQQQQQQQQQQNKNEDEAKKKEDNNNNNNNNNTNNNDNDMNNNNNDDDSNNNKDKDKGNIDKTENNDDNKKKEISKSDKKDDENTNKTKDKSGDKSTEQPSEF